MEITPQRVKNLREKTGAGMMDCKNALTEAAGDEEKAIEILRKKGLSRVEKRSRREAREGLVEAVIQAGGKLGVLVEVDCETDFVAKTDEFRNLVGLIVRHLTKTTSVPAAPDELLEQTSVEHSGKTVRELFSDSASKLGENLILRRFARYDVKPPQEGWIEAYVHTGAKLGVMLELGCNDAGTVQAGEFRTLARDIALHIAAANPLTIAREQIPTATVEKEQEIYRAQIEAEGKKKPPEIVEKIISGKMERFYSEICLLEQPFVKIPEKSLGKLISETATKLGDDLILRRFCRFKIGE